MEKLVRRHCFRKEPGHLACRAGPIVFSCLLALLALPKLDAQTYGHPAKVVRILTADTAPRTKLLPLSLLSPRTTNELALPEAETVTAPEPEPVLIVRAERLTRRSRVVVTEGPYLPAAGPTPLRFAAVRRWPDPLPQSQPEPEGEMTTSVAASPANAEPPAEESTESRFEETASTVASETTPPPVGASASASAPSILTADMVLGFLSDMPGADTVPVRFEPAQPPPGAARGINSVSP